MLGGWLKQHLAQRRNTLRFLLPKKSAGILYIDRDLTIYARAVHLAEQWKATTPPTGTPPKTPVNLPGEVEKWGMQPATIVSNVNLNVSQMTGAQLKALLSKLPDGVTYALNLDKEKQ